MPPRPARGGATTTDAQVMTWASGARYRTHGMASIRVVLAEDNALLREGISRIIDGEPDLDLVGRAADLPELLELIEDTSPDVVVTDIRMPPTGTDEGIQAASWLREHKPEVGVVVLSQYKTPSYALALLETGSAGRAYLLKEQVAGADELAQAIRTVAQAGSMIDPQIVDELIEAKSSRRKSDLSWLTPRESEILGRDGQGQEQCGHRRLPAGLRAGRGEAHQLHLLQARAERGARRQPAGQGGPRLPERPRRRVTPPPRWRGTTTGHDVRAPCENGGMSDRLPVLIVDDQAPFRAAMKAVLKRAAEFELVGEAANGNEAVSLEEELNPALVLMDINMPEMNGIEATRTHGVPAPRGRRDPVLHLRRRRPAARGGDERRPRLPQQGAPRRRHAAAALGGARRRSSSSRSEPAVPRRAGPSPAPAEPFPISDSQRTVPADGAQPVRHVDVPVTLAAPCSGSKPGPSSATVNSSPPDSSHRRTSTCASGACFAAFCSASRQQK